MGIAPPARVPRVLWLIAGAVLVRVAAAATGPLIDDEAYYWLWAHHLDWGYLDHPPMIAYLISLTTSLGDLPFLIRVSPLVLGAATTYTLFLLGREMFGARAGLLAAVLFQIVPVLAGGGLLATPDAPLFLAWATALRFVWQALHGRPAAWLAAGLAVGVGLLSKLTMILLPLGLLLYLVLRSPRWLRRSEPYVALLLAALIFSPVIYWNAQHAWAGVSFIAGERLRGRPMGLVGVTKLLEEQLAFALILLPAFAWALLAPVWRRDDRLVFLTVTSLPALIFPFIPAYAGGWPHGNWLAPVYLSLTVALGALWNRAITALAAVNAAAMAYALLVTAVPLLPLPPGAEEVYGWQEAGMRVRAEARQAGGSAVIVADRYQVAAQLGYYTRSDEVTLLPCPHPASIWPPPQVFAGREAIAVIDARWQPTVRWEEYAARVDEAPPLRIEVRGHTLRTFRIYRLHGFNGSHCPAR